MVAPWHAERRTTVARARTLLAAAAPHLDTRGLRVLAEGWDNTVVTSGAGWLARFPRRAVALPGVRREISLLPRIAPLLPLAVPVPDLVADDDGPGDPWPFTLAQLVPGRELADAGLADALRGPAAAALGAFLRALHSPRVTAALGSEVLGGLPVDPMERGWPRPRVERVRATLVDLERSGAWRVDPAVAELLHRASALGPPRGEPVLVHGDLHARHVLVSEEGSATGVIDWGDACLADPAVDLGLAYAAFEGPARAALLAAYGGVDAERELRARAVAVRLSALLADYAAGDDRPGLLAEALAGLRRAVA